MKQKQKKTKYQTIPIYLDLNTKEILKKIQIKYHASISSIARSLFLNMLTMTNETLHKQYIKNTEKKLTYIKPKLDYQPYETKHISKLLSNFLYLYANKKIKEYYTEEQEKIILDKVNKDLQRQREYYWNLNDIIRQQKRALSILSKKES